MIHHHALRGLSAALLSLALGACTLAGEDDGEDDTTSGSSDTVVLVTHDSFTLPEPLLAQFERDTGIVLEVRKSGDAGSMTSKLVLNQGNPLGDVAYGVDNTFASRALQEDVFADYQAGLPPGAEDLVLEGEGGGRLTPVDHGPVCVNYDERWFEREGTPPPRTLDDLADPAYRDLFVTPGATTSSPGLAFLLATIAKYGEDGWQDYWTELMANGAKLTSGWEDAYFVDFTGGAEKGTRPIVLSYATSPAFTIDEKSGDSFTTALLDTCFRQVEYAGVLENAANPEGAQQVVDFLVSEEVQAALPESMFVYPASSETDLPADWVEHATLPESPYAIDPADIDENRDEWLTEWRDLTSR